MLTEEQLQAIEAAERVATAGPWIVRETAKRYGWDCPEIWLMTIVPTNQQDKLFVVGARIWVPQLLVMVRELQGQLRVCAYDLNAAEDGMVEQRSLIVERLEAQVRELQREKHQLYAGLSEAENDILGLRERARRFEALYQTAREQIPPEVMPLGGDWTRQKIG